MTKLTLNRAQIQAALNDLVSQPAGLNALLQISLNAFMKAERDEYLSHSQGNKGNGYRGSNGLGIGKGLELAIPRDRLGHFKPWILHVMRESQEQMHELFFELYAKGLTTREIESITQSIYGQRLSSSSISRITQQYSEEMALFRERPLQAHYPIIYLDATFISTRREHVSKEAYYVALAVKADMTREIIGIYNAPTESGVIWDEIISDLKARGLQHSGLFVTDDLLGLDSAIEKHFTTPCIQKCVLHLKRNVLKRVKKVHRQVIADELKGIFDLENRDDHIAHAQKRAERFYQKWAPLYSHIKLFNDPSRLRYYFTYLNYHPAIRNMIYTTNWIERFNKDIKRTTKIRNSMPSVESVLTLISKVAIEKNLTTYNYPIHRLANDSMFQ